MVDHLIESYNDMVSANNLRARIERQGKQLRREHAWRKRAEDALRACRHQVNRDTMIQVDAALSTDLLQEDQP